MICQYLLSAINENKLLACILYSGYQQILNINQLNNWNICHKIILFIIIHIFLEIKSHFFIKNFKILLYIINYYDCKAMFVLFNIIWFIVCIVTALFIKNFKFFLTSFDYSSIAYVLVFGYLLFFYIYWRAG